MKIEYSKFDFNKNDIGLFLFFLFYIQPSLLLSKNMKDIVGGIIFLNIATFYFIYRFYLVWILKKNLKISFLNELIEIKGMFFIKKLRYDNIRNLTIRKNYLKSYDIVINYDESINFFRYLNNYFFDKFSFGKNCNNSFILCDVKNMKETLEYLLKKIGYCEAEKSYNELYIRYSLFEEAYLVYCIVLLILWLCVFEFPQIIIVIIIYLIVINIRFFKRKYIMTKYGNKIKIFEKNKIAYIIEDFYEDENSVIIEYNIKQNLLSKHNFYYFSNNILPRKYMKKL